MDPTPTSNVKAATGEQGRNTAAGERKKLIIRLPYRERTPSAMIASTPTASNLQSPSRLRKSKYVPMELREPHDENYDPQPYPINGAVYTPISPKQHSGVADGLPKRILRGGEEQV